MRKTSVLGLLALTGLLGSLVWAQETKGISWKHGLSFQVRKAGQIAFEGNTPKYGAEVFLDKDLSQLVYIAETASLGLGTTNKLNEGADVKPPLLYHAVEMKVRPPGEKSFDKARKFSAEVFKDTNADNLVYISEIGSMSTTPATGVNAPDKVKDPVWYHGLDLKVRKAGEKEFTDATKKVSLEVYKDDNTNHLVYVTDSGLISVVPSVGVGKPSDTKDPVWFAGFEVKVRAAKEDKITKDTKAFGIEVYKDENANMLIYISETGAIAVVPAGTTAKPSSSKDPVLKFGRAFSVRKADEKNFTDKTQSWGAEVYKDENTGNIVYITETGYLAVASGK